MLMLVLLLAALSGCGFRLRGHVDTPDILKDVHISGIAEYSELYQTLKKVLQRDGSRVTLRADNAESVMYIHDESYTKRVLSVDAQGRAAEYELIYRYQFQVTSNAVVRVPTQEIQIIRDFRFDPNNVLAKDAEEAQLRKEMIQFSVRQMMRRVESHLKPK